MEPWQKWATHKPRAGQTVRYIDPDSKPPTDWTGKVSRVEGARAWVDYGGEEPERFTWCFHDKLNSLHDWPTKAGKCDRCGTPAVTELDGDNLCQAHADAWCRGEADDQIGEAA
jgi:hypothetical protein